MTWSKYSVFEFYVAVDYKLVYVMLNWFQIKNLTLSVLQELHVSVGYFTVYGGQAYLPSCNLELLFFTLIVLILIIIYHNLTIFLYKASNIVYYTTKMSVIFVLFLVFFIFCPAATLK